LRERYKNEPRRARSSLRKPKIFALLASFAVQFLAEGPTALNGETTKEPIPIKTKWAVSRPLFAHYWPKYLLFDFLAGGTFFSALVLVIPLFRTINSQF
jgi:hypothetical protein